MFALLLVSQQNGHIASHNFWGQQGTEQFLFFGGEQLLTLLCISYNDSC